MSQPKTLKIFLLEIRHYRNMGMPSGGVRVVHQNREEKKNSSEFFEAGLQKSKRFYRIASSISPPVP
jgi:hypothetical protein